MTSIEIKPVGSEKSEDHILCNWWIRTPEGVRYVHIYGANVESADGFLTLSVVRGGYMFPSLEDHPEESFSVPVRIQIAPVQPESRINIDTYFALWNKLYTAKDKLRIKIRSRN